MNYFHFRDGWDLIPDEEGMEFPNLDRAQAKAYASTRDLAAAAMIEGHNFAAYSVEVADEIGTVLSRVEIEPIDRVA